MQRQVKQWTLLFLTTIFLLCGHISSGQAVDNDCKVCCANDLLDEEMEVDNKGTNTSLLFLAEFGNWTAEWITIQIIREALDGKSDTAVFSYNKKWEMTYLNSKEQNWASIKPPVSTKTGELATGEFMGSVKGLICFFCQVSVSNKHKNIIIRELLIDDNNILADKRETEIKISTHDFKDTILPSSDSSFVVYPNPTKDQFFVQGALKDTTDLSIYIMDVQGNIISNIEEVHFGGMYKRLFDIRNLPAGMYFVVLDMKDEKNVLKVIKE